jgi:hypothetical protein
MAFGSGGISSLYSFSLFSPFFFVLELERQTSRLLYYVYQKLHVAWPQLCRTIGFFFSETTHC